MIMISLMVYQNIFSEVIKMGSISIRHDWAIAIVSSIIGAIVSILGIQLAIKNENRIFITQLKEDRKNAQNEKNYKYIHI